MFQCWTDRPMPEQPINKPKYNAGAGNACVVRWREYAHGGRARVAATVALVWQRQWFCPLWQQRWTTASKEAIPSRAGELGGASVMSTVPLDGWWSRTLSSVCAVARARVRRLSFAVHG